MLSVFVGSWKWRSLRAEEVPAPRKSQFICSDSHHIATMYVPLADLWLAYCGPNCKKNTNIQDIWLQSQANKIGNENITKMRTRDAIELVMCPRLRVHGNQIIASQVAADFSRAPSEVRLGWATLKPHAPRILSVTFPNTTALSSGEADAWTWCTQARVEQTGCFKSADRRATLQGSQEVTSDWKNSRAKAHVRLTKVNIECLRAEMYNLYISFLWLIRKYSFRLVFGIERPMTR